MTIPRLDIDIVTPPGWVGVDLEAVERVSVMSRLVDERVASVPALAEHRNELIVSLTGAARSAREQGVIITAVMLTTDEDDHPIVASLNVAAVPISGDAAVALLTGRDGSGRTHVRLRAGAALRVERDYTTKLYAGGEDVAAFTVQYFLPLPDTGMVVVTSFVSPSLSEREWLEPMFERIAGTLSVSVSEPVGAGA